MSLLTESINTMRAEQLKAIAEKEAKEKADAEVLSASRSARQAKIDQIYTCCQTIIDESHLAELFEEVNREFFKGTGRIYDEKYFNFQRGESALRGNRTDFYVRMGIKGVINKTPTLLTADATLSESSEKDVSSPALTLRCSVGKQKTILDRVFRRRIEWNWGVSETLRERVLEEQDQSIKEWQNPDNVAKLTAKVLLKAGVV